MAIFFALLTALFIGFNTLLMKMALMRANPFTSAVVLTFVGTVLFWILAVVMLPLDSLRWTSLAFWLFIIAGLIAPALVRLLIFTSINRVGTPTTASLFSISPVFSVVIAIILLDESISFVMAVGLGLIISGIIVFERDMNTAAGSHAFRRKDLALPLLAALFSSLAVNIRKMGLEELNYPVLGAALGFTAASILYICLLALSPKLRQAFTFHIRDMPVYLAGGLSLGLGWLCIFYALSHGPVVLVAPLISLHPLVVLLLHTFFLRDVETITGMNAVGICVVLLGVVLITANA